MNNGCALGEKLTIIVHSCDTYEDLWLPFFTLLKKYWNPVGVRILLNTETKDFTFEGLDIECVHCPGEKRYGQRMIHALKQVRTSYVLSLLDDFFIRTKVDEDRITQIIRWMENDPHIVCFNCDPNRVYTDWEVNKYHGYRRLPHGNDYMLSMQAGIWKTEGLKKYWLPDVSPWEWEVLCTARTTMYPKDKFYCTIEAEYAFLQYGHNCYGDVWGVYRGKWIAEDVKPLFEKENIHVDLSLRGVHDPSEIRTVIQPANDRKAKYDRVRRCLGRRAVVKYFVFNQYRKVAGWFKLEIEQDYFRYLQIRAKARFLKKAWK